MNKACQMACLELLRATSSPGELVLGFATWGQDEGNIIGGDILGGYWDGVWLVYMG